MSRFTQFASNPASGRDLLTNQRDGLKSCSHVSAKSKHQSLLPGALPTLDLRTVKRLSQLAVSPCHEKQLDLDRLASHRTVRYHFVIAVR
jgi:hypothetical protein